MTKKKEQEKNIYYLLVDKNQEDQVSVYSSFEELESNLEALITEYDLSNARILEAVDLYKGIKLDLKLNKMFEIIDE